MSASYRAADRASSESPNPWRAVLPRAINTIAAQMYVLCWRRIGLQ
ncbi:hypothetical protein [Rubripirellula tenax]|nr:hypothetical protein [Rubripirellula tenax]